MQGLGRAASEAAIGGIAVISRNGRPIFIRDVAEVRVGPALKRGEGSHNGEPAVVLGIQKQPGANTLELTRRLDAVLDDIQRSLLGVALSDSARRDHCQERGTDDHCDCSHFLSLLIS